MTLTRDPADSSGLDFLHAKPTTPTIWRVGKRVAWSLSRATSSYTRRVDRDSEERDIFGAPIVVSAAKLETRSTGVAAVDLAGFIQAGAREGSSDLEEAKVCTAWAADAMTLDSPPAGAWEGDSSSDLEQAKVRAAWAADTITLDSPSKRNSKTVIEVFDKPVAWGRPASAYTRQKPAWEEEHDTPVNSTYSKPTTTDLSAAESVFAVLDERRCVQDLDEKVRVAEKTWQAAQEFVLNVEEIVKMRKLKVCVHV